MRISITLTCLLFFSLCFAQEVGTNDFQISLTGEAGETRLEAKNVALAYNSTNNEYLAVWTANNRPSESSETVSQYEVWGQRLHGNTGAAIGEIFRISDMGPEDSDAYGANAPAVTYNSQDNEYLVVWYGDDNTGNAVRNEAEIWGQRIDGATGAELGQNDFRISTMGPNGNPLADGKFPALAYNSQDNEYMVVWYGDVFFDEKLEVWGQRLAADGRELGANDFRISVSGGNHDVRYGGYDPAITYNSVDNEYLVVWYGGQSSISEGEEEIWGQRMDADGNCLGAQPLRISDIGKDNSKNYDARSPNVIFNSTNDEYLVDWSGNEEGYDKKDFRTWGQRIDGVTGTEIGENDFLISNYGPDRVLPSENHVVDVAYDHKNNHYLVVWSADDFGGASTDGELEIWGKRLNGADGTSIGSEEFRISDVGSDGNGELDGARPYIVFNSENEEYLVAWEADEVDEEFEIYGQRLAFESAEPTCEDGIQNGDEEGVDCGGSSCADCPEPSCDDGIQNGDETGIDCGGSDCPSCPSCDDGIQNGDESGIDCGGSNCPACPNCDDGIQNGDETDVDCGGSDCPACPTCDDGMQNGNEVGIDCGGDCAPCQVEPTCDDGIQNGNETDVDCGGSDCPACPTCDDGIQNGNEVGIDCGGDCAPCQVDPTCNDGIQNGNETGIDCGGDCAPCQVEPTCDDGIQNGNETGIDCGGDCAPCQTEPICTIPENLASTDVQARQATLTWDVVAEANNYTVQLRAVGSSNWNTRTAPSNTGLAKPLRPNTTYEWHVRANCDGESSEYSPTSTFTTASNNRKRLENRGEEIEIIANEIELFPNPTNTLLNIQSSEEITQIQVLDITGRVVVVRRIQNSEHIIQLNVNTLNNGHYLLRVQTTTDLKTLKFVKQ